MLNPNLTRLLALSTASMLAIAGCGQTGFGGDGATQVIARVNGSEISQLQFANALERAGITTPSKPVRQEVATKLVDRELAIQQALASELDRRPEVMLALQEARRDVLARAWAESVAAEAARPSDNQVAQYYAKHPELFAERKIYRLREATLSADSPRLAETKARFARGSSLEQVAAWLRQAKVPFNAQIVIRAAEQLPIEALPRLGAARVGETVLFETPRGIIAYELLDAQAAPVKWEAARPIIVEYLARQTAKHAVEAQMQRLRTDAKIAYLGDTAALFEPATGAGR
jgi:EpsD family peptidyl-prolyl cis-trans isomerase